MSEEDQNLAACSHQHNFILIEQTNRYPQPQEVPMDTGGGTAVPSPGAIGASWHDEFGARVGCPICGEIRIVWANGDVVVTVRGKMVKWR